TAFAACAVAAATRLAMITGRGTVPPIAATCASPTTLLSSAACAAAACIDASQAENGPMESATASLVWPSMCVTCTKFCAAKIACASAACAACRAHTPAATYQATGPGPRMRAAFISGGYANQGSVITSTPCGRWSVRLYSTARHADRRYAAPGGPLLVLC